jgi:hypothetical protein
MPQLTKAQLVVELSSLREAYARLQAECESLRAQRSPAPAPPTTPTGTWKQRAAQARAQAMASGRPVLV